MTDEQFTDPTDPRTIVARFLDALTYGEVARYIRIGLFNLSGLIAGYGLFDPGAKWVAPTIAIGTFGGTLAWSIWGNRLVARIKNLMATGQIAAVVPKDRAIADAVPDHRVTPAADTTVVVVAPPTL